MGKTKKNRAKDYPNSTIKIGNDTIAKTYTNSKGDIINQIVLSPEQEERMKAYEDIMHEYILNLDSLTPEYYEKKNATLEAMKNKGIQEINDTYLPMIEDLKNDIVSRFGTLNTSTFLDNLNDIEKHRSNAISDLETNLLLESSNMDKAEREEYLKYIALLNEIQNSTLDTYLDFLGLTNSSSKALGSFINKKSNDLDLTPLYMQ